MSEPPLRGIADRSAVDVPAWADGLRTGDTVDLDTPKGVIPAEILGFSQTDETYGKPVVEVPEALAEHFEEAAVLVVREQDLAREPARATDGGLPEDYEPPKQLPTAQLRDGEHEDPSSHAARNAEQLRIAERELGEGEGR